MEVRLLKMLKIITAFGIDGFDQPPRRDEIVAALAEQGFWDFEISRMFEWLRHLLSEPNFREQLDSLLSATADQGDGRVAAMSLSERAHSFLSSVRDLGLIDEAMEDEILNQLMMNSASQISFEDVRRTAAGVIFDRQFRAGEEYYGIFEEEWKLLFN